MIRSRQMTRNRSLISSTKVSTKALDTFDDRAALTGANGRPQTWAGVVCPQVGFDTVGLLDLANLKHITFKACVVQWSDVVKHSSGGIKMLI